MKKDNFGVWEITVPPKDGQPAIPHNSKIKVSFTVDGGHRIERLPAWIRYAVLHFAGLTSQAGHAGPLGLAHLRRRLLEPAAAVQVQEPAAAEARVGASLRSPRCARCDRLD